MAETICEAEKPFSHKLTRGFSILSMIVMILMMMIMVDDHDHDDS